MQARDIFTPLYRPESVTGQLLSDWGRSADTLRAIYFLARILVRCKYFVNQGVSSPAAFGAFEGAASSLELGFIKAGLRPAKLIDIDQSINARLLLAVLVLFGLLPGAMAWSERYTDACVPPAVKPIIPGGKVTLSLLMGAAGIVIAGEFVKDVAGFLQMH